jgi:hypothetical protein
VTAVVVQVATVAVAARVTVVVVAAVVTAADNHPIGVK